MICRYLTPTQVLEAFRHCHKRFYPCLSDYHQKRDLTKSSCQNFSYYMALLQARRIQPSTLIFSNAQLIQQILPSISSNLNHIRHLSLLECPTEKFFSINPNLAEFKLLTSLHFR